MKSKSKENSVKSLITLYTVIVGAALSLSISRLIPADKGLTALTLPSVLLFVAYISTLFPFFHGALRHLDDAYIENDNEHIKDGAMLIDFAFLLLHALAFVVLALLLDRPTQFAWVMAIVLAIDVIWGGFVHFASSSAGPITAEGKWTIINLVFVAVTVTYLVLGDMYFDVISQPLKVAVPIMFACVVRSVIDYVWCRSFYFPK